MLPLPLPATDPLRLADWLEIGALVSPDRHYGVGDLGRVLGAAGVLEDVSPGEAGRRYEAVELICLEVFREIQARAEAGNGAYPFTLRGTGLIEAKVAPETFSAYIFCLCLSYFGEPRIRDLAVKPRRVFEHLATIAAGNYLGGTALRFASPRADLPRPFPAALLEVCNRMGEGVIRTRPLRSSKDAKLDVVAWRDFPDRLPGKLIIFGQCASGQDWEEKLGELEPLTFCGSWLSVQPPSRLIKAFFTPHRIDRLDWEDVTRGAGLFFDRCRLAFWVHNAGVLAATGPYVDWYRRVLQRAA